jgi:hypothetical protein
MIDDDHHDRRAAYFAALSTVDLDRYIADHRRPINTSVSADTFVAKPADLNLAAAMRERRQRGR